jgi:hypothetical protein
MQHSSSDLLTLFGVVFAAVFAGVAPACLAYWFNNKQEREMTRREREKELEIAEREREKIDRKRKIKQYMPFVEAFIEVVTHPVATDEERFALAKASNKLALGASESVLKAYKKFQDGLDEGHVDVETLASELFNQLRIELEIPSIIDLTVLKFYQTRKEEEPVLNQK